MAKLTIKPARFGRNQGDLDKRTYLPFVLTSTCPRCGEKVTNDLREDYISYPQAGKPADVLFAHDVEGLPEGEYDWHEWTERVVIGFTLKRVTKRKRK